MRGTMMAVPKSVEGEIAQAVPFTGNDTDRWNAVAVAVLLMALAVVALVNLALQAARS
jgi:hypothetical protein